MKTYSITDIGGGEAESGLRLRLRAPGRPLPNLLIVADGMGGHNAGNLASRYTVELMVETSTNETDEKRPVLF